MPKALQCADDKGLEIHTIIIHEDDPKFGSVSADVQALQASGCLHRTPVIIAIPSGRPEEGANRSEVSQLDYSSDDTDPDFKSRMTTMQKAMVREEINRSCSR